jgi:hypothetical protein
MRACAVLLSICATLPIFGGTTYRVSFSGSGTERPALRVIAESRNRRIEMEKVKDSTITWDSLLSPDEGRSFVALNSENQTWFTFESVAPLAPSSHLFMHLPGDRIKDIHWSIHEESVAGEPEATRKYVGRLSYRLSYDVAGSTINVSCSAVVLIWTTDRLEQRLWVGSVPFATGYAGVDAELAGAAAGITGFPVKTTLSVTRQYEGGPPMTQVITSLVSDIHDTSVTGLVFQRPADYREQKPLIGAPGKPSQ